MAKAKASAPKQGRNIAIVVICSLLFAAFVFYIGIMNSGASAQAAAKYLESQGVTQYKLIKIEEYGSKKRWENLDGCRSTTPRYLFEIPATAPGESRKVFACKNFFGWRLVYPSALWQQQYLH